MDRSRNNSGQQPRRLKEWHDGGGASNFGLQASVESGKLATRTGTICLNNRQTTCRQPLVEARVVLPAVPPTTTPAVWELGSPGELRKSHVHGHLEAPWIFLIEDSMGVV